MAPQRLPPATRAAAWLVTGPLGHLAGGVVDWATFLAGYARGRVRTTWRRAANGRARP